MTRLDPAWLDAQYNARAANPDHEAAFARWVEASARARQRTPCRLDLPYGEGAGETVDWFGAPGNDGPVLVFLHGGYWRSCDKSQFSFLAPAFVAGGADIVVPNYDLCPAVTIEQIVLQTTRALAWLHRECTARKGRSRRLVVAGHSAGGHLAAMMLACDWKKVDAELPRHPIHGALAISGLYDLEPLRHAPFLAGDLRLTPASAKRLSPARFVAPRHGLLHAVVGEDESGEFQRQNRLIEQRWGPQVVAVCATIARRRHFDILDDLAEPGARLHALARQLLGLSARQSGRRPAAA